MRTTLQVMISTIALSVLLVSPTRAFAQADQPDSDDPSQRSVADCAATQCLLGGAPVLDAPFSAEVTTVWHPPASSGPGELRATAHYYRDSAGRVRVEQGFAGRDGDPRRIILTPDANSRLAYLLNPVARTVTTPIPRTLVEMMVGGGAHNLFVLPLSTRNVVSFHQLPADDLDSTGAGGEESLKPRSIAGVQATGTRFLTQRPVGAPGNGRGERWASPELKVVVYSRIEDPDSGTFEYRLTQINRTEPRAALFEVPADDVETPAKYPFTWVNSYPKNWRPQQPRP